MGTFEKRDGRFLLDGRDFKLISGAIHYFRVPREYWRDRLEKLRALGCNAVETYVPWNLHEPEPGAFRFDGMLDLEAFVREAAELGLKAIVRPSPYICAELEFGGLPWWLLREPGMRVRTPDGAFQAALRRWYAELVPRLAALQCTRGGPVIACQVENEYGYFGNNIDYLRMVEGLLRAGGIEVLLFTVDGPWGEAMEAGSVPGILMTGSFGSGAPEHFRRMRELRPGDPLVCGEFWMGWFDAWGDVHHVRDAADAAKSLDEILAEGHVNLYMFHGGTNFGFTSGANDYGELKPDVTSYDYDAPLSECGDFTPKYHAFREVISRRHPDPVERARLSRPLETASFSTHIEKRAFGTLREESFLPLGKALGALSEPVAADRPLGLEELGTGLGYALYALELPGPRRVERCVLFRCRDRATVYVNGRRALSLEAGHTGEPFALELDAAANRVEVLVECMGRVNFGEKMDEQRKGLGSFIVDKHAHCRIESRGLRLEALPSLPWSTARGGGGLAGFSRFTLDYRMEDGLFHDSFLRLDGWGKGVAWINGRNLGRFWEAGPQRALYVPGAWLVDGRNELVVLETEGKRTATVELAGTPDLG